MDTDLIAGAATSADPLSVLGLVIAALGVGALHALDADHVMAVSGLASRRPTLRACLSVAWRWSLGHGATLALLGGAVWWAGSALPAGFALLAERVVSLMLCGIGVRVLLDLYHRGARLRVHRHPGLLPHVHWVLPESNHERHHGTSREHGAVLVGALHGAAGSAPMIALASAGARGSLGVTLAIVLAFSLGVLAMMLLFGGLLGQLIARDTPPYHSPQALNSPQALSSPRALASLRALVGSGSILLGAGILVRSL
jgi:hypothetical protein